MYLTHSIIDINPLIMQRDNSPLLSEGLLQYFHITMNGMALLELDGRFRVVNQAMCNLLGYSEAELLTMAARDITYPEDLAGTLRYYQRALAGEQSNYQLEKRYVHKNGSVLWGLLNFSLIRSINGEPSYGIAQIQDMTACKTAEQALVDSQCRYEKLFHHAEISMWEADYSEVIQELRQLRTLGITNLRQYLEAHHQLVWQLVHKAKIKDVNQATLRLFGAQTKQDLINSIEAIYTRASYDVAIEELCAIWEGKTVFQTETTVHTLHGKDLTVTLSMPLPTIEDTNSPIKAQYIPVTILDITARKQAEEAVRENATRLKEAQQIAHIGNWEWDIVADKIVWSEEHYHIFDLPLDEVITNARFINLVHPKDRASVLEMIEDAIHHQQPFDTEYRIILTDGNVRYIHSLGKVICGATGKAIRLLGTVQDITERKLANAKLRDSESRAKSAEKRLTDALENISEGFALWDADERLMLYNNKYREFHPLLADEVKVGVSFKYLLELGIQRQQFADVLPGQETEWLRMNLARRYQPRKFYEQPLSNNTWLWVKEHRTSEGGIVEIRTNITGLKVREKALYKSGKTLRAILDATTDTILLLELDGTCVTINPMGATRFGVLVGEMVGRSIYNFLPATVVNRIKGVIESVIANRAPIIVEDDSMGIWFEGNFYPVLNEQGNVARIALFARNITKRRHVEQALRDSENKYRTIINTAAEGYWFIDAETALIIEVNEALCQMLGCNREDIVGKILFDFVDEANSKILKAQLNLVETTKHRTYEMVLKKHPHLGKLLSDPIESTSSLLGEGEDKVTNWYDRYNCNQCCDQELHVQINATTIRDERGNAFRSFAFVTDITPRKCIEAVLRKERDFTDAIINTAGSLVVVLDRLARIIRFNHACEELTGYTFAEVKNQGVWQFLKPEESSAVKQVFKELATGKKPVSRHENHWVTKDLRHRLIDWSNTVLLDAKGNIEYVIATGIDVTERRQAEIALQRTLAEQNAILNNSAVGIAFIDVNRQIRRCNRKLAKLLGYSEKELEGRTTEALYVFPEEYERIGREGYALLQQGETYKTECLMRTKQGRHFWCQFLGKAIDTNDLSRGYIWNLMDITEQKRAVETLRLTATVFETMAEGVYVTNAENKLVAVNPAFTTITGYTEQDVLGQTHRLFSSKHYDTELYKTIHSVLTSDGKWQGEGWAKRKNGENYPLWLSIAAIKNKHNVIKQHIVVFSDITQRKRDEAVIHHQANYDALTDLPNRALFLDRLSKEMRYATREIGRLVLMFIDLDRFKWVNDNLGHSAGDQLLCEVAYRLKACVREDDTVARFGGDEFVVLFSRREGCLTYDIGTDIDIVAARILESLAHPFMLENQEVFVSGSIGISVYPEHGQDAETLIKHADAAMYAAKGEGRNRYKFYSKTIS